MDTDIDRKQLPVHLMILLTSITASLFVYVLLTEESGPAWQVAFMAGGLLWLVLITIESTVENLRRSLSQTDMPADETSQREEEDVHN